MNQSNNPSGTRNQSRCAACAQARQRCPPDCPLRPYFPNDNEHLTVFQNVHKLFGRKKVLKLLTELQPHQRNDAMNSIIFEANAWARFPIQGCVHIINTLNDKIQAAEWNLELIRQLLALDKSRSSSSVPHGPSCAACAYEKKICNLQCPFRYYFPNDDDENRAAYIKLQKVFEYDNILGMIEGFGPEDRVKAIQSFIFEANLWEKNPARGCIPVVEEFNEKIAVEMEELNGLKQLLAHVRGHD